MIDVSELLHDPDFAVAYTVERRTGRWQGGRFILSEPEKLPFKFPVQPASAEDLEQLPSGDRKKGIMKFFVAQPKELYATMNEADWPKDPAAREGLASDTIIYRGQRYRIISVMPWREHGWCRAFGHLI